VIRVTIGALAVIRDRQHRVLLVRTTYAGRRWQLPGGYLEDDELAVQALRRELREELSVEVEVESLAGIYHKIYERNFNLVFFCRPLRGHPTPDRREIEAAAFFALDSLPDGFSKRGRTIVTDCLLRRGPFVWSFSSPEHLTDH